MLERTTLSGWMLSWAAFHARTYPLQGEVPVLLVNAQDFGQSLPEPLASFDQGTWSLRTFQHSFIEDLNRYSETLPGTGTMRRGVLYRLRRLAPRISGSGSSLWPTPAASLHNDNEDLEKWAARRRRIKAEKQNGNGFGMPLTVAVRYWPAPGAGDSKCGSPGIMKAVERHRKRGVRKQIGLRDAVRLLLTPTARAWQNPEVVYRTPNATDWKNRGTPEYREGRQLQLQTQVGGQLNPTFVEWLMNFPKNWTEVE